jgi:hypothetical protein
MIKVMGQLSMRPPGIPPTQLVVRSYSAYKGKAHARPESHQRSWWIVHIQPNWSVREPSQAGYLPFIKCIDGIRERERALVSV